MNININLTKVQQLYLPAIQWLISDENRREGKSYLLATAFIMKAFDHLGRKVYLFDHYPARHTTDYVKRLIYSILESQSNEFHNNFKYKLGVDFLEIDFK